jgi:hypothetical protein
LTDAHEGQRAAGPIANVTVVLPCSPVFGFLRASADQIFTL